MTTAAIIRCEALVHDYPGGPRALAGVDLEIVAGERVAIVGRNGSGKTTLIHHWNGLLRPTAGRVLVAGRETTGRRVAELARIVGVAFQDPGHQIFSARARREVEFGGRNVGLRGPGLRRAVDEALDRVGLAEVGDSNPYDLGFSRRKLLALASILVMATPVVVLDEPTTGQDARGVGRVRGVVASLAAEGRTIVAITHDLRFAAETFGRIVVMGEGRVLLDGPPSTVFGEAAWPVLRSTGLEPPLAARLGAAWGLGSTPTEESLISTLAAAAGLPVRMPSLG